MKLPKSWREVADADGKVLEWYRRCGRYSVRPECGAYYAYHFPLADPFGPQVSLGHEKTSGAAMVLCRDHAEAALDRAREVIQQGELR